MNRTEMMNALRTMLKTNEREDRLDICLEEWPLNCEYTNCPWFIGTEKRPERGKCVILFVLYGRIESAGRLDPSP